MALPTKKQVRERTGAFRSAVDRAEWLRDAVAIGGYTIANKPGTPKKLLPSKLRVTVKRDVAQFVFFEVAVLFEVLARHLFEVEVRSEHSLTLSDARKQIASADGIAKRSLGWAVPRWLQARGRDLRVTKLHASLKANLGDPHYDALVAAHRLRNRIAHGPKTAHYTKVMDWAGVPKSPTTTRQGCDPGRLLLHYGHGSKSFDIVMAAYRRYADVADSLLP